MGRHRSTGSTSHRIARLSLGEFRLSWVVDFYYPGDRLRYPRRFTRYTDEAGALRFAKRWGVQMPAADKDAP